MKSTFFTWLIVICMVIPVPGSNENLPAGARGIAMGNASVTLGDPFASFSNQGGLAGVNKISLAIHSERRWMLGAMKQYAATFIYPTSSGTFGCSITEFGYNIYKENKIGIAFGKKLGEKIMAGIQIDYLSVSIREYGQRSVFTFEAGIISTLSSKIKIGVHLYNPVRAKLTDYQDERIPTVMKFGVAYEPSKKIIIAVETEKDLGSPPVFKAGIEYKMIAQLHWRAGISTSPVINSFGLGYNWKKIKIDVAASYHYILGFSPHCSLSYDFE